MRNGMNVFPLLCRSSYGLSLLISNKEHKSHVAVFSVLLSFPICKILSIIPNHGLWTRQRFILIIISYMASCPGEGGRIWKSQRFPEIRVRAGLLLNLIHYDEGFACISWPGRLQQPKHMQFGSKMIWACERGTASLQILFVLIPLSAYSFFLSEMWYLMHIWIQ